MQGFNMGRYIPPEHAGLTTANKLAGKHALGSRARKISQGILTVRFEMPFHIWCGHCPQPTIIAQGVRFNAEKKKVGHYHTTSIWSFRMKHAACGGWIEIRTDPKNAEYVVTEGGRRRDYGEEGTERDEQGRRMGMLGEIVAEEERERRRNDAFAALEGRVGEKKAARGEAERVEELRRARERDWEDPYAASQRLRRGFRAERKVRVRKEREAEELRDRLGLGIELLEEDEGDARRAELVEFGDVGGGEQSIVRAAARPLFDTAQEKDKTPASQGVLQLKSKATPGKTKAALEADKRRLTLQQELKGNTRAAMDPFLSNSHSNGLGALKPTIPGLRKKQPDDTKHHTIDMGGSVKPAASPIALSTAIKDTPARQQATAALVNYDSD